MKNDLNAACPCRSLLFASILWHAKRIRGRKQMQRRHERWEKIMKAEADQLPNLGPPQVGAVLLRRHGDVERASRMT